jgi:transcriptional regulator with XRE-family HTH domain
MKSNELAHELNISSSYLSEIEKGKKTPSVDLINKYSQIFNIKPSAIMFFSENLDSEDFKSKAKNNIRGIMLSFLRCIENAKPETV